MRLIDADALMKVIREHDYPLRSHFNSTDNGMFTIGVQQAVDDAPTIDAAPVVRGEWIVTKGGAFAEAYCSECEHEIKAKYGLTDIYSNHYCPNCGAKMYAEEDKP